MHFDQDEFFFSRDFAAEKKLLQEIRRAFTEAGHSVYIPTGLSFPFKPDIAVVYLTLFQEGIPHIRWGSRRATLDESINHSVNTLRKNSRFADFAVHDENRCRILFEIVTDECACDPEKTTILKLHEHRLEPGIHGLKLHYKGKLYYYMPTDAVTNSLMSIKQVFNYLAKRTGVAKQTDRISRRVAIMRSLPARYAIIRSFACISYKEDVLPLYRGYPVPVAAGRDIIRQAMINSSDWVLNNMKPDGSFLYYYDPVKDSEVDFQHPRMTNPTYYNILRHSGGTITLLRAYELTGERRYLTGAADSIAFLLSVFREHTVEGHYACYPFFNKKSKLGGAGIGLAALVHHYRLTTDERHRKYMDGLVRHILSRVSPSGEMIGYFIHPSFNDGMELIDPNDEVKKELFSFYYPGEALLGLVLYLRHIPDIDPQLRSLILEKGRSALDFLIHERPRKYHYLFEPLPADGWLMQAIEEWVKIEGFRDQAYIDFVFNDAQAMIDHMYQEHDAPFFDYTGAFYYTYGEHAYPDGARCEGLMAAWHLADYLGDVKKAAHFMPYLRKAAKNLLYTYNTPQSSYAHRYPAKSLYSFRFKFTRQWMRVDSVQHTACFFARLYPVVDFE